MTWGIVGVPWREDCTPSCCRETQQCLQSNISKDTARNTADKKVGGPRLLYVQLLTILCTKNTTLIFITVFR